MVIFQVSLLAESLPTCLAFISISVADFVFPQTVLVSKGFFTVGTREQVPLILILVF